MPFFVLAMRAKRRNDDAGEVRGEPAAQSEASHEWPVDRHAAGGVEDRAVSGARAGALGPLRARADRTLHRARLAEGQAAGHRGQAAVARSYSFPGPRASVPRGEPWSPSCLGIARSCSTARAGDCPSQIDYRKLEYRRVAADVVRGALDGLGIDRARVVGGSVEQLGAAVGGGRGPGPSSGPPRRRAVDPELGPPGFFKMLVSPIGWVIVRLPSNTKQLRSILTGLGHGPT